MSDIVDQLRERAQKREEAGGFGDAYHFDLAAAEITRLREALAAADERTEAMNRRLYAAILDEREACVQVAEEHTPATQDFEHTLIADSCESIAHAIRARWAPPLPGIPATAGEQEDKG